MLGSGTRVAGEHQHAGCRTSLMLYLLEGAPSGQTVGMGGDSLLLLQLTSSRALGPTNAELGEVPQWSLWPWITFPKSTFHPIFSFPTSKPVCAISHPVLLWFLPPRLPLTLISMGLGGSRSNYKASPLGSGSRSKCDTGCGQIAQLPPR